MMRHNTLIRMSVLEVWHMASFRVLLLGALLSPLLAFVFASLFMLDLGKVFVDAVFACSHLLAVIYLLFLAAPFLAQDLKKRFYFMLVGHGVSRQQYLLTRFIGLATMLLLLLLVQAMSAGVAAWVCQGLWEDYASSLHPWLVSSGCMLYAVEYLSLIAVAMLLFSWVSGEHELLVMLFLVWLLCWIFPPVLMALQDPEVAEKMPEWMGYAIHGVYQLLPHLNGTLISLHLAHGDLLPFRQVLMFLLEHVAYAAVACMMAVRIFSRRDF